MNQIHIFLDETGCVLGGKMMPDVTLMVPGLEIEKHKNKQTKTLQQQQNECQDFSGQMWWNNKLPDLAPTNPPIPEFVPRNSRVQARYMELSKETSDL
jgi:hypothetical protein